MIGIEFFLWVRDFGGYKVPIRPGAILMAYDGAHNLCFQIDAAAVVDLLSVQVRIARIVDIINAAERNPLACERLELGVIPDQEPRTLEETPDAPVAHLPRKPPAPPAPPRGSDAIERKDARREQRRSRKPRPSAGAF